MSTPDWCASKQVSRVRTSMDRKRHLAGCVRSALSSILYLDQGMSSWMNRSHVHSNAVSTSTGTCKQRRPANHKSHIMSKLSWPTHDCLSGFSCARQNNFETSSKQWWQLIILCRSRMQRLKATSYLSSYSLAQTGAILPSRKGRAFVLVSIQTIKIFF